VAGSGVVRREDGDSRSDWGHDARALHCGALGLGAQQQLVEAAPRGCARLAREGRNKKVKK
jgi:hypothetical protein